MEKDPRCFLLLVTIDMYSCDWGSEWLNSTCNNLDYLFHTTGILVKTPVGIKTACAMLLQLSVDLPARALVLNMKHFNGAFACWYCESEGETLPGDHLHHYWPYVPGATQQTHQSLLANARKAVTEKTSVRIWKKLFYFDGYSDLVCFFYYNVSDQRSERCFSFVHTPTFPT